MTPYRSGIPIDSIPAADPKDPDLKRRTKVYQSIVGSINWVATCTRPDVSPVLSFLASYSNCPSHQHYKSALHVLKYLYSTASCTNKGTKHINLRENYVRELHQNGTTKVTHIPGVINASDLFTKELKDAAHFSRCRDSFMVSKANFERCGHVMPSHRQKKEDLPYYSIRSPVTLEKSRPPQPRRMTPRACRMTVEFGKKVPNRSCRRLFGQGGVDLRRASHSSDTWKIWAHQRPSSVVLQ
jgi:hypothetical protein